MNQFPEWVRFTDKAASAEITPQQVESIKAINKEVVDSFEQRSGLADPEIPELFRLLGEVF